MRRCTPPAQRPWRAGRDADGSLVFASVMDSAKTTRDEGTFRVAPATLQSMYAPEFAAYSSGAALEVAGEG